MARKERVPWSKDYENVLLSIGQRKITDSLIVFCQIRQYVTPEKVNFPRIYLGQMEGSYKQKLSGISPDVRQEGCISKLQAVMELLPEAEKKWKEALKEAKPVKGGKKIEAVSPDAWKEL